MARHLAPGGLAVVDVWLPDADDLARFDGRLILEYERTIRRPGALVTKVAAAQHDAASGIVNLTTIYEEGARASRRPLDSCVAMRCGSSRRRARATSPRAPGWRSRRWPASYDLEPLGPGQRARRSSWLARR